MSILRTRNWFGGGSKLQYAVTTCCLLAFTLFGYDQGVFGGILQNSDWLNQFNHPSDTKTGIIVSSYNLGCLGGCFVNFFIGQPLGRRKVMWIAALVIIIGAILQCSAYSIPHLVIGRVITGIGTGIETSTVPMYQAELCSGEKRGRLVSAEVLFVGVGIVFAYWFDFGMSYAGGSLAWRLPIALQIIFAIIDFVVIFGLPESPRWLFTQGRDSEAIDVLCLVYGQDEKGPEVSFQIQQIRNAIEMEKEEGGFKWSQIFKKDDVHTGKRILLAWGVQFMNQVGGINLVVYYIPSVLVTNVGMTPKLAQILGGCVNMMFMFGSILPSFALDSMGRRRTMFWGCSGLGFCMMMISILLSFKGTSVEKPTASASVTFFFLYMLIFGASVNCVPWVYVPEILPLQTRAKGTAIGISSNWLWNFVIVMITPILINRLAWKAYLIFMATNFAFVPLFYFFYPETSNKSLEEIDYMFITGAAAKPWTTSKGVGDIESRSTMSGVNQRRQSAVEHMTQRRESVSSARKASVSSATREYVEKV